MVQCIYRHSCVRLMPEGILYQVFKRLTCSNYGFNGHQHWAVFASIILTYADMIAQKKPLTAQLIEDSLAERLALAATAVATMLLCYFRCTQSLILIYGRLLEGNLHELSEWTLHLSLRNFLFYNLDY